MKTYTLLLIIAVFGASIAKAQITVSNITPTTSTPPTTVAYANNEVTISNFTVTSSYGTSNEDVSARYNAAGTSNIRGITQTFSWNGNGKLKGIGILVGNSGTTYTASQTWHLDIQSLTNTTSAINADSVFQSYTFSLDSSKVTKGHYLYIAFNTPLVLSYGALYGFNLYPTTLVSGQDLRFEKSNTNDVGRAGQSSGGTTISTYNKSFPDFNFYMTADTTTVNIPFNVSMDNERSYTTDSLTGRTKTYLTNGTHMDYIFYMHTKPWKSDNRYFFAETDRPRPSGRGQVGEHQLLSIDSQTGNIYWLATIPQVSPMGVDSGRKFHASYSPAGILAYLDMSAKKLIVLRLSDGKRVEVATVPSGSFIDPPEVSDDGHDIIFMASLNGPTADSTHTGNTYAMYHIGFEPATMSVSQAMQLITSSPGTKGTTVNGAYTLMPVDHAQLRPGSTTDICYVHELTGLTDGSSALTYIWHVKTNGTNNEALTVMPNGKYDTHAIFGHSGQYVYFVRSGQIFRVKFDTKAIDTLTNREGVLADHLSVSMDEKRVAYDSHDNNTYDTYNDTPGKIGIYDLPSNKITVIAKVNWGLNHPRHPHPAISPDGTKVIWNEATQQYCRIALIDSLPVVDSLQVIASKITPILSSPPTSVSYHDSTVVLSDSSITTSYGTSDEDISARYKVSGTSNIRGITQTFTWNTSGAWSGVGLLVGSSGTSYAYDQGWKLNVYQLVSDSDLTVSSLVKSLSFTLKPRSVSAGNYLYLKLKDSLALSNGNTYGINLYPVDLVLGNDVRFEKANTNALGWSAQNNGIVGTAFGKQYKNFNSYFTSPPSLDEVMSGMSAISLSASKSASNNNLLNWVSSGGANISYRVQKSADGITFNTLLVLNISDNSSIKKSYEDANKTIRRSFYRILATNAYGKTISSNIVSLKSDDSSQPSIMIYPNPTRQLQNTNLSISGLSRDALITIRSLSGKVLESAMLRTNSGKGSYVIRSQSSLPGIYIIELKGVDGSFQKSFKLLVE